MVKSTGVNSPFLLGHYFLNSDIAWGRLVFQKDDFT